jgi:hypothetical protein
VRLEWLIPYVAKYDFDLKTTIVVLFTDNLISDKVRDKNWILLNIREQLDVNL